MKIILRGGFVVSGRTSKRADVLIDGEKIENVGHVMASAPWDTEVVDVTDCYLFPGFIDAHTHFDLAVAGTTTADDFESGTRAALRGGTTSIIDFACPNKGETLAHGLRLWHEKADGKCWCDYGFHMTIDDWNDGIERELDDMIEAGITSFKMYLTYPAMLLSDEQIYLALTALKKRGGVCGFHCENAGAIDARIAMLKAEGHGAEVSSHPLARPDSLEAEAVNRVLRIAQMVDTPVIIVHTTSYEALFEIEAARTRGQTVYAETCPQYLLLNDSVYYDPDYSRAARYVCAPPIRTQEDADALWLGLRRGSLQTISTDHCSFTLAQKEMGRGDFTKIPGGLPGVETRGELIYTAGVAGHRLSLAAMCRVLSENPAKLYGLYPRKGVLAPGSDADIVVYDPNVGHVLHGAELVSKAGYTPFEGFETSGSIRSVYLRGALAVDRGEFIGARNGLYLQRGKCTL
ncbi:MAG: dihydropyrimidinase [Ruminococcaceae bacterium]|jgi:dihydropyrimidinase|nr:dihydropyrimidinase [Oscillospiraceae bacterium]